ncbi:ZIP family metal transporter [Flavicella sediminum]|uniref:ZIP family metal transporter n=1 Tax=Flavicella sediminum TaxID=2585141 RepID=UPI00111CCB52|nr:ZIP family metal transporter [Flavicella sediminum]
MIYILLILSVLVGMAVVSIFKPKQLFVRLLLSFSGAYLLAITILHLVPEVYGNTHGHVHSHSPRHIGIFILAGIIIQSILESFSKGAEHGHIHLHSKSKSFPWLLFVSLSIHAFSEGIPVGYATESNLLWAICIHKIPISIVLATFLLNSSLKKSYSYLFILLFAMMSPLGVLLSEKLPLFITYHAEVTAITIGIFLHISTIILFESSENHKFNYSKFVAILCGLAIALMA